MEAVQVKPGDFHRGLDLQTAGVPVEVVDKPVLQPKLPLIGEYSIQHESRVVPKKSLRIRQYERFLDNGMKIVHGEINQ